MPTDLKNILAESWAAITAGAQNPGHALRNIVVAHNAAAQGVNAYTVVLRAASEADRQVVFFTDYRSPKVGQISTYRQVTFCGYDAGEKCQLILTGEASIHYQDEVAQLYWDTQGHKSPQSYLAQPAPTTAIDAAGDGLAYLKDQQPDGQIAYGNFAVVKVSVNKLEWLKLNHDGNRRAQFTLQDNGAWQGTWLIP